MVNILDILIIQILILIIIHFCYYNEIIINNLIENELYAKLKTESFSNTYGFIYNVNNNEYLCSSSEEGRINIIDLYNKKIVEIFNIVKGDIRSMIEWNNKYIICADCKNKSIIIIDLVQKKVISQIKGDNIGEIKGIKKLYHPIYGEALLTGGGEGIIKLWVI